MAGVDNIGPTAPMQPTVKVVRKKRSARDSNRNQKPANSDRRDEQKKHIHVDKTV